MVRGELKKRLNVSEVKVDIGSLHAGTQCCEKLPALHYREPGYMFHPGTPAFQEDIVIPWEGTRLINAVKESLPKLKSGEPVRWSPVSAKAPKCGRSSAADRNDAPKSSHVEVLCAYKPGLSWLMDEIAPQLKGKHVASMKIEFKRNEDPTGMRVMFSPRAGCKNFTPWMKCCRKNLPFR